MGTGNSNYGWIYIAIDVVEVLGGYECFGMGFGFAYVSSFDFHLVAKFLCDDRVVK